MDSSFGRFTRRQQHTNHFCIKTTHAAPMVPAALFSRLCERYRGARFARAPRCRVAGCWRLFSLWTPFLSELLSGQLSGQRKAAQNRKAVHRCVLTERGSAPNRFHYLKWSCSGCAVLNPIVFFDSLALWGATRQNVRLSKN